MAKLTPEAHAEACQLARMGVPQTTIAQRIGVDRATVWRWVCKGASDPSGTIYSDFSRDFTRAQSDAQIRLLAKVQKAADADPKYATWLLERLYPNEFGSAARVAVHVEQPSMPVIDASVTVRQLEAELEALDGEAND